MTELDQLRAQLAEAQAEIERLVLAIAGHQTKRSEYCQQLAEAQAEIERLRADVAGSEAAKIVWFEDCMRTKQQLAASQAINEKLREALDSIKWHRKPGGSPSKFQYEIEIMADRALALPNDTTALNAALAAVYEECSKVCETSDRYRGDYFAAKIRALAKQKGLV